MAKYILVEEEADPDNGCEIWLYDGFAKECKEHCVVAVANSEETSDPEYPGGFHVAHTCRPHGEYLVKFLNKGASNA